MTFEEIMHELRAEQVPARPTPPSEVCDDPRVTAHRRALLDRETAAYDKAHEGEMQEHLQRTARLRRVS